MAFTYVLTTNRGKVRFLVPDNDSDSYDLEDAEVDYFLTERGSNVNAAAVDACKWLARKYSKVATFSEGGLSYQATQRAEVFAKRAAELEADSQGSYSTIELDREDGYSDAAEDSEYESRTVYIEV